MNPLIYGNCDVLSQLHQMMRRDRMPHGVLFYGESGLGKKIFSRYVAASLLCSGDTEEPCGSCKSCRMIQKNKHPDFQVVEHSGKLGGFSVETVRQICTDLIVPPNEGQSKCYLFGDCDAMDARSQNILLKVIEEPPDNVYFFFTAQSPTALLPTIRSRIVSLPVSPLRESVCMEALTNQWGYSPEEAQEAMMVFHGNLGKCVEFLENDEIRETVALTKSAIYSIINRDEYGLLLSTAKAAGSRAKAKLFLTLLNRTIRDAATKRVDTRANGIGCDEKGAFLLSQRLPLTCTRTMHLAVDKTLTAMEANVNLTLAFSALSADLMDASSVG
ncbi:MAG: hypothetical protein LIO74_00810 [Ruminococcus sp.]|nr:hypothetical protein [Ruminococcus sp.]